jgi:hypothetical protein
MTVHLVGVPRLCTCTLVHLQQYTNGMLLGQFTYNIEYLKHCMYNKAHFAATYDSDKKKQWPSISMEVYIWQCTCE